MDYYEFVNCITMIVGSIVSTVLFIHHPFYIFWIANIIHMPFSVGYHFFLTDIWRTLDIIFIYITSCMYCYIFSYYVFSFETTLLLTNMCCFVALYFIYDIIKNYNKPIVNKLEHAIKILYVVLFYLTPLIYSFDIYSAITITSLLIGFLFYSNPFTLKYIDSHNIMHFCIVIAHIAEYMFIYDKYDLATMGPH